MIRGNRAQHLIKNDGGQYKFWGYLPLENGDDGSLGSDNLNLKTMLKTEQVIDGKPVIIEWDEIIEVIDNHGSGSTGRKHTRYR